MNYLCKDNDTNIITISNNFQNQTQLINLIGSGSYGEIFLVEWEKNRKTKISITQIFV